MPTASSRSNLVFTPSQPEWLYQGDLQVHYTQSFKFVSTKNKRGLQKRETAKCERGKHGMFIALTERNVLSLNLKSPYRVSFREGGKGQ